MSRKTLATLEAIRRDAARTLKVMKLADHPAGADMLRGYDRMIAQAKAEEQHAWTSPCTPSSATPSAPSP